MKSSKVWLFVIVGMGLVWTLAYTQGRVTARVVTAPAKVGVVNVNTILQNSKKHKQWQERMSAEEQQITAEMDKLQSELDFMKKDLATLKKGSDAYIKLMRDMAEKDGVYQAKKQYYDQEMTMKVQAWTEQLYAEIQARIAEVAQRSGLDLVIGAETVEIPAANMRELLLDIKTNKVLYHAEGLDITNEVLAALDAGL